MPFLHAPLELLAIADDIALNHLAQQVVAFTRTLPHSGKHAEAVVALGNVVDELLDKYRLSHAGTTEEANLTAFQIGFQQVNDLDAGKEHLLRGGEVLKTRRLAMDG